MWEFLKSGSFPAFKISEMKNGIFLVTQEQPLPVPCPSVRVAGAGGAAGSNNLPHCPTMSCRPCESEPKAVGLRVPYMAPSAAGSGARQDLDSLSKAGTVVINS